MYVVLNGSIAVTSEGKTELLDALDSVHLPRGAYRQVENLSDQPATMLVIIADVIADVSAAG